MQVYGLICLVSSLLHKLILDVQLQCVCVYEPALLGTSASQGPGAVSVAVGLADFSLGCQALGVLLTHVRDAQQYASTP